MEKQITELLETLEVNAPKGYELLVQEQFIRSLIIVIMLSVIVLILVIMFAVILTKTSLLEDYMGLTVTTGVILIYVIMLLLLIISVKLADVFSPNITIIKTLIH